MKAEGNSSYPSTPLNASIIRAREHSFMLLMLSYTSFPIIDTFHHFMLVYSLHPVRHNCFWLQTALKCGLWETHGNRDGGTPRYRGDGDDTYSVVTGMGTAVCGNIEGTCLVQ